MIVDGETATINLLPFVVEALGYNRKIHKDIDRLYQTRKYEFYQAAKNHELYTNRILSEGSLLQEEYCKKALGILLCANGHEETFNKLEDIFKKGWTYAFLFVKNHEEIDLEKFLVRLIRKAGGPQNISASSVDTNLLIVNFMALNAGKKIIESQLLKTIHGTMTIRWRRSIGEDPTEASLTTASKEVLAEVKKLKSRVLSHLGQTINYDSIYQNVVRAEIMAFMFDFERISFPNIIEGIKFSEKDIDEILYAYLLRYNKDNIDEALDFLSDAMYVKYMAKAYKEVKKHYFQHNQETLFVELEGMEKEMKEAKEEVGRLNQRLSDAEKIQEASQREITRLRAELAEARQGRQELNSLREFFFSMDPKEGYTSAEEKIDLEALKQYKAVVVGGHERWQSRMKELLPSFTFIHPDKLNFDKKILDGVEGVFIYANYLSHAMYYRVVSAVEGTGVKLTYLNQQNEEKALEMIYKEIKKNS